MTRPDRLFETQDLDGVLESQGKKLRLEASQLQASDLQAGTFGATEARVLAKFTIAPLEIDWAQAETTKEEVMAERASDLGRMIKRQEVVLRIRVPFTGDAQLFKFSPVAFPNMLPRANVIGSQLEFVYQRAQHELERLKKDYDEDVRMMNDCVTKVNDLLAKYQATLPALIRQALEARRDQLQVMDAKLAELGFNVRKRDDPLPAATFPITRKQIVPPPIHPVTPRAQAVPPGRALPDAAYDEILSFLAGMSLGIERSPSTFAAIAEEPLRDWFVVALNGTFKGDATGETFNREGKTDISIRVDGNVIFIAECKFWSGKKGLIETLIQLLGYLTWRDTKAGILLFIRNADFSAVLKQVPSVVSEHPSFVRHLPYASEAGFRFVLRNKTDVGREHVVTLLAFHITPT